MTDEQIEEIYALARESFFGGQTAFQVQAYPFRMTAANFAKHRANPNIPFWKMLKQGNDHFELTRQQPKVDVCEKRYVFNAQAPGDPSKPLSFSPAGKCPVYEIPQEVAAAVSEKQRNDEVQVAEIVRRGAPVAPVRTGVDGGMHPVFANALDENGQVKTFAFGVPGTIPSHVNPPRAPDAQPETSTGTVAAVTPAAAATRVASADPAAAPAKQGGFFGSLFANNNSKPAEKSEGVLDRMSRMMGLKSAEPAEDPAQSKTAAARAAAAAAIRPKPAPAPAQTAKAATPPAPAKPQSSTPAEAKGPPPADGTKTAAAAPAANNAGLLPGAQPIVAPNSFDSRWSAFR
jgi:hypothetical protein